MLTGRTKPSLAGAAALIAFPGTAWAAQDAIHGAPLIALLSAAGLWIAIAAGLLLRRQAAAAAEAEALKRDLGQLDALLAASPDGYYVWNADGGEGCSRRLADWLGITPGAVTRFTDLARHFKEDDFTALDEAVACLRADGVPFALDLETADGGRSFSATGAVAPAPVGGEPVHLLWLREATEDKAERARLAATAAEAAAESERFRELLDAAPFPVWRRRGDLSLDWCNKAYAAAVDSEAAESAVSQGMELVPTDAPDRPTALAARALESGVGRSERRHVVIGGDRHALEIRETPLPNGRGTAGFARDLTELEEARAELERHVKAHADVLGNLTTPIAIFGSDKRLKFFNSAYARLRKLKEDWLVTEPTHGEVLEALREGRQLPEEADFPAYKKKHIDLHTSLTEPREDIQHLPDGRTLRVRVSPHPLGGLLFLLEDVTDQLELERARNTLIAVQRATLDNLHEGVAVFGPDGRLKLFNPHFARIWQLDDGPLASQPHVGDLLEEVKDLLAHGDDWEEFKARVVARTTDRTSGSRRHERPDGSVIDHAFVPLPDGNILSTFLDVTDSVRIERALRERNEALETSDRLKSEFVANVSYELRTPLNTIIGFSEILNNQYFGSLNARQHEYIGGILDSSHLLLDLINNILDVAMIEAGRMVLEPSEIDLYETLSSVLAMTRNHALKQKLNIDFDCPPDIGRMMADERRLKQVLFNLMSNAMKFTAPGGTITLGASRDGTGVELWVADTGVGIPLEEQQRVFGKFHKSTGQTVHGRGTGLGLSLVKSFIELHGGQVALQSTPGAGTRVSCVLPAKLQKAAPRAAAAGGG